MIARAWPAFLCAALQIGQGVMCLVNGNRPAAIVFFGVGVANVAMGWMV